MSARWPPAEKQNAHGKGREGKPPCAETNVRVTPASHTRETTLPRASLLREQKSTFHPRLRSRAAFPSLCAIAARRAQLKTRDTSTAVPYDASNRAAATRQHSRVRDLAPCNCTGRRDVAYRNFPPENHAQQHHSNACALGVHPQSTPPHRPTSYVARVFT